MAESSNRPQKPKPGSHKEIPVFPFEPHSIKESRFNVVEAGELRTHEDIQELMQFLWSEPETVVYYFMGRDGGAPADALLLAAKHRGDILMDEMERRYYRHPRFDREYVQIIPKAENLYDRDWEREAVEIGPEYWRVTLKLSQRERDVLDAWRKVQLEEKFRQQARKEKYNYDVFLSYSTADSIEAGEIRDKIEAEKHTVFMAPKDIRPGDDFAEEIRQALLGARDLWLLVSTSSSSSEWVATEWGAAWVLGKRIVPILHRCAPESLPPRLAKLHCIDLHRCDKLVEQLNQSSANYQPSN